MNNHILIADDDTELCQLLADYLSMEGFTVADVHDGKSAVEAALATPPDLLVLDIMLPGLQGLDVLKAIRTKSELPVIMLTARGDDTDRIAGLELGADDYVPKPCNPQELVARIKAVLRRTQQHDTDTSHYAIGGVDLDSAGRHIQCQGVPVHLTSTEFDILRLLMENAGQVVDKDIISERVLKRKLTAYDRSIDVHISRIRASIEKDPRAPRLIQKHPQEARRTRSGA